MQHNTFIDDPDSMNGEHQEGGCRLYPAKHELLPLSWIRTGVESPVYRSIALPLSGLTWVTFADLPYTYPLDSIQRDLDTFFPEGYLLRGCSGSLGAMFLQQGGRMLKTGEEAVLHLQNGHFEKRSLRKLLQQAGKKGRVLEVPLDIPNRSRLDTLQKRARHGNRPQLQNVFRASSFELCRCFVFLSTDAEWLAAVTVSERGDHAAHTELMLKQENAPSGIMEMLLAGIFTTLRDEGYAEWSLGEVPFYHLVNTDGEQFSFEEHVVALTAGLCRYAYDFKGLYSFKNKFGPEWRDVYLYSKSEFSLLTFADLAVKSRYSELLAHTMFDTFRKPFS